MPTIADYLRALNAPPSMGELSAATTQPWLVPGAGTGPGAQLIMKDPAGVAAAAEAQASAAGPVNRYAGLIWGDSPGQAQGNLLTRRAQDLNAAAQAAARAQQAQQFNAQQQRLQEASHEAAAWRQAEVAQRTRNDTLDFLSKLAEMEARASGTSRAMDSSMRNGAMAEALGTLNQTRDTLGESLTGVRQNLANLPAIREDFTYTDDGGHKQLGVPEDTAAMLRSIVGWAPDAEMVGGALVGARSSLRGQESEITNALARAQDQYRQTVAQIRATPPPPGNGLNPSTVAALLAAAGISSPVSRGTAAASPIAAGRARPLLVPGWNGSAASDPRYRRVKVDFNAPGVYGPQTVEETMGFTPQGPVDYPSYDRQFGVTDEAPVTRMQMLPDGSLIPQAAPTGGGDGIDPAFQQALDSSLNKQALLAPLASELARRLSVDPERLGGSTMFSTPEAQVYDVIRSLTGGNPEIRARINALPPAVVNQLFRNAMIEARRNPARTVSRLGLNI